MSTAPPGRESSCLPSAAARGLKGTPPAKSALGACEAGRPLAVTRRLAEARTLAIAARGLPVAGLLPVAARALAEAGPLAVAARGLADAGPLAIAARGLAVAGPLAVATGLPVAARLSGTRRACLGLEPVLIVLAQGAPVRVAIPVVFTQVVPIVDEVAVVLG